MKYTHTFDKSKWGDGPWQTEPDRVDFIYRGLPCLILRNEMGNLCGYVGLPNNHPFYNKGYSEIENDINVHGGLTYANSCNPPICHTGEPDDVWWLGFDCAHYMDYMPGMRQYGIRLKGEYRDINYVTIEIKQLADQLIKYEKSV